MNDSTKKFALFEYGFRPFFFFAGLYAVIAMVIWLLMLITGNRPDSNLPPYLWHGHEMLFGFVGAAIAGFLLTAVPSWTGQRGYSGWPLIALVIIWLAGRLFMAAYSHLPLLLIAAVDLAFFPVLGFMLGRSLLQGKPRNIVFLVFLAILFIANLLFHFAIANNNAAFASSGLLLGINTVLLILSIIGGRIVPAFTQGAVRRTDHAFAITPLLPLDRVAVLSIFLVVVVDIIWPYSRMAGWLAVIAAVLHGIRFARWKTQRVLGESIVWILHAGYAWLIIGFILKGVYLLTGSVFSSAWLHAFTTGAFATMILGVMSRAALGHTGRPLVVSRLVVISYLLIILAAVVRICGPLSPAFYQESIVIAGILWIAAFLLFLIKYTPILISPRVDGNPG